MGTIKLSVAFGEEETAKHVYAEFVVVDCPSAYNALIGRATLDQALAAVSIRALTLAYVSDEGRAEKLYSNQEEGRTCNGRSLKRARQTSPKGTVNTASTEAEGFVVDVDEIVLGGESTERPGSGGRRLWR
ncbi:hypothetical protein RND81_05G020000 [Saponaria officinalis]|uniref:Uncharacterized protein n=1 Tax=Saponaria officinalis TaxID=3572 RepID=A0AAW1KTD1_SAPOF